MLSRLGDRTWVEVIRRHNALIEEVTAAHGGTVIETQGDGSMLAFSSARRAVACAQAIQREIDRSFADLSPPIQVRIGIHTGDAIKEAEHFFGTTVHYAARVASHALGGEVLVSSTVHELVGVDPGCRVRRGSRGRLEGDRWPAPTLRARSCVNRLPRRTLSAWSGAEPTEADRA